MKKSLKEGLFILSVVFAVILGIVSPVYAGGETPSVRVYLNGNLVKFPDVQPCIIDSRTLIPVRAVTEVLGAQVDWDGSTQTVLINKGNKNIRLTIGSCEAAVNDSIVKLDAPAVIADGRTMVPIRFISEILGAEVKWNSAQNAVMIDSPDSGKTNPNVAASLSVSYPEGCPQEFIKIREILGDKIKVGKAGLSYKAYYSVIYYENNNAFVLMIRNGSEEILKDIKIILQVFYPTGYEEAYKCVLETCDNIESEYNKTYDGRLFECKFSGTSVVVRIK